MQLSNPGRFIVNSDGNLITYRLLNKSNLDVAFKTSQNIKIIVAPGSVIDLYSFEIENSPSFLKISQPEVIEAKVVQSCPIDINHLEQIKQEISMFRDFNPANAKNRALDLEPEIEKS